jgi:hypothetical protein
MPVTPYFSKFKDHFTYTKLIRDDGCWWDMWTCKHCGVIIKANTAGAQSHLAMHLRQRTKETGETDHD